MIVFLLFSSFLSFVKAEKEGILIVMSKNEKIDLEKINRIKEWKEEQGFEVWFEDGKNFSSSSQLKSYLNKVFKIDHPNLKYLILPINEFQGVEYIQKQDLKREIVTSSFYYETITGVASVNELYQISLKENGKEIKVGIACAQTNFLQSKCIGGSCAVFDACDPSWLGQELAEFATNRGILADTYFEQEGFLKSGVNPKYSLKDFKVSDYNLVLITGTASPLRRINNFAVKSIYDTPQRVWWEKDRNNDNQFDPSEGKYATLFDYTSRDNLSRIGFVANFKNTRMNLNCFSSLIGIEWIDGFDQWLFFGDGRGMLPGIDTIYRFVMKNILNGKSVGESTLSAYEEYAKIYEDDNRWLARSLLIRGDPSLSLDLIKDDFKIDALIDLGYRGKGEFKIINFSNQKLSWEIIDKPDWIKISKSGEALPGENKIEIEINEILPFSIPKKVRGCLQIKVADKIYKVQIKARVFF